MFAEMLVAIMSVSNLYLSYPAVCLEEYRIMELYLSTTILFLYIMHYVQEYRIESPHLMDVVTKTVACGNGCRTGQQWCTSLRPNKWPPSSVECPVPGARACGGDSSNDQGQSSHNRILDLDVVNLDGAAISFTVEVLVLAQRNI
ncbi:hypothetical protein QYE76_022110 [Lolium multiflorum]|uniref:Uncharacterized protein n=1 Tax=Lolium multiflorum TaxID=4521 RepID=A0AAD8VTU8_LOLMU|nr:hypothetical protein QYE76_022110 [Lolium multiflorum]